MAPQIAVSHGPEDSLLEDALLEHDASLRVSRLLEVHSEPAVAAGENFASDISRANADVLLAGGRRRRMSLIAKRMPSRESQVGFLQEHSFFDTEIMMYAELLPHLEDALRGQGVSPLWPAYLGQKGNYLIFSDLKSKNYRVPHRLERLDLDHAMLAMKAIALFHGSSVVAKASGRLDKLIPRLEPTFMLRETAALRRITEGGFRACGQAILRGWGSKWQDIGERLVKRSQTVSEELLRLGRVDESRLNVVNHGDLWTTNLMFKYSKLVDRPVGLRFIDFQISHYNSYAYDLIYFLNTSIPPSVRRANQDRLLSCYRRALAECLSGAGLEHLLPSLEGIQEELRRLELYRLSILICILPMQIAQVEGALNFDNLISDNEDHFAQHPEVYSSEFFDEVHLELIKMDKEGGVF